MDEHPTACWNNAVNAAVLGFDRAGVAGTLAPAAAPWSLGAAAAINSGLNEVFDELAALAIYELAGRATTVDDRQEEVPRCDAADRICSRAAAQHLAEILHGGRQPLLPEWTAAAAAGGWYAPPEALPALLELATTSRDAGERDALLRVAGQRGRWLAEFNPSWRLSLSEPSSAAPENNDWETASRDQRLAMLRRLRLSDRAAASELVDKTWDAESAADRTQLLEKFATGLNADDEPWLESRLDDRSKQVRAVAAELLSRLPESALGRRMADRVLTSVKFTPGGGLLRKKPPKIEISLPDDADEALKRDSVEPRTQRGLGAKASMLSQIVALAPLTVWRRIEPDEAAWMAASLHSEWGAAMFEGWLAACRSQRDAAWAAALLSNVCLVPTNKDEPVDDPWRRQTIGPLMEALPPDRASMLAAQVAGDRNAESAQVMPLLLACEFPWNDALSATVLEFLARETRSANAVYDQPLRQLITDAAPRRLAPALADRLAERLGTPLETWSDNFAAAVQELVSTVRFRREMLAALAPAP
jgi:hypothetical protein